MVMDRQRIQHLLQLCDSTEMPSRIPIGLPISGTTVYVMQGNRICGVGVPGELCIGGAV